jgi:hypothetical protein
MFTLHPSPTEVTKGRSLRVALVVFIVILFAGVFVFLFVFLLVRLLSKQDISSYRPTTSV